MMMDNSKHLHQQVVQLNNTNSQNVNQIQQQLNNKSPEEAENFLTIRLLMQGKVSFPSSYYFIRVCIFIGSW